MARGDRGEARRAKSGGFGAAPLGFATDTPRGELHFPQEEFPIFQFMHHFWGQTHAWKNDSTFFGEEERN